MGDSQNIKEAIKKVRGNDSKAAKILGMSYYDFRYQKKKIKNLLQNAPIF